MATRALRIPASAVHRTYIGIALLIPLIAFTGFWPTYFGPLLQGIVEKPSIIHLHAAVYSGWLALFVAQVVFASTGNLPLHRKLGKIGIYYAVALFVVGITAAFSQFADRIAAGNIAEAQRALLAPLTDMIVFPAFFGAAIYYRRNQDIHKRLMIVATTALLVAAVARLRIMGAPLPEPARLTVWFSPILFAMAHDFYARRLVHPVYVIGLATLLILSQRRILLGTDAWLGLSGWLATFFA